MLVMEKEKRIYLYCFGIPNSAIDREPKIIKQVGIWPSCLSEEWKTGNGFPGKSTSGPGAWDFEERTCSCGKHLLRSRKTFYRDPFSRSGEYALDIQVEVIEI